MSFSAVETQCLCSETIERKLKMILEVVILDIIPDQEKDSVFYLYN